MVDTYGSQLDVSQLYIALKQSLNLNLNDVDLRAPKS